MFKWMNFFKKDKTPTPDGNLLSSGVPLNNASPLNNAPITTTSPITNTTTNPLAPTIPATNTTSPLSSTSPVTNTTSPLSSTSPVTNTTSPSPSTISVTNTNTANPLASTISVTNTNTASPLTSTSPVTDTTSPLTSTSPVTDTTSPLASTSPVTTTTSPLASTIPITNTTIPSLATTISQDVNKITSIAIKIKELSLFTSIGDTILSEISSSGFLSPTSLDYIIDSGQKIIDNVSSTSGNSTDISQYISTIDEMLKLPPLQQSLNHDNLVESNINSTVQNIIKYYNVCEKSLASSSNETLKAEFASLTPVISGISSNFTNLISVFKNFKSSEHNLRQEIEAYTNAVTQMQSQGVNIDWGGKKEAFEQKGAELTNRRNAYVEEEKQINSQITNLSSTISSLYPNFIAFLNNLKSDLTSKAPDPSSNIYESQINTYLQYSSELKSIVISE